MLEDSELLGVQSITDSMMTASQSLTELAVRFILNLVTCWIIVHFFYYKKSHRRDYYFTFMAFSSAMLLLLHMMGSAEIGVGLTLGLFAIFGVIRYRTETVPIREMTYLFVIIALAAVNGLSPVYRLLGTVVDNPHYVLDWTSVGVTALSNCLVILLIWVLESEKLLKHVSTKYIQYDRIDLIVPEKKDELIADVEKRTGLKVDDIEVGYIDFLKDSAFLKVRYTLKAGQTGSIDRITRSKQLIEQ